MDSTKVRVIVTGIDGHKRADVVRVNELNSEFMIAGIAKKIERESDVEIWNVEVQNAEDRYEKDKEENILDKIANFFFG